MRQITDRQLEIIDAVLAEKNVGGLTVIGDDIEFKG